MKKTNNKGFSLVELIIVIAIMAVLVGILAPQFVQYVERSRRSTDIKNIQEMVSSIQVYCADVAVADGSDTITLNAANAASPAAASGSAATALTNAGLSATYSTSSAHYEGVIITVTYTNGAPAFTVTNAGSSGETTAALATAFGF